jgi:hypothetical protein
VDQLLRKKERPRSSSGGKTRVLVEERAWRGSSDFWSRAAWRMPAGFKSPDLVRLRISTKMGQPEELARSHKEMLPSLWVQRVYGPVRVARVRPLNQTYQLFLFISLFV